MTGPYDHLPPTAFWRSGVAQVPPDALQDIYRPMFAITATTAIATAGSCFAQHIGRVLRSAGVNVVDAEPAPAGMPADVALRFGYGLYAARYGNVYTTRQFVQLLQDAETGHLRDAAIWQNGLRYCDGLRPTMEPAGLDSVGELRALRHDHLVRVKAAVQSSDVFVFTAGLTETWADRACGTVYPVCPGVIAGQFYAAQHMLVQLDYGDILGDLEQALRALRRMAPGLRMIVTVSPVPLTATASGAHVLTATTRSKAILRAALGAFADRHADVDYFPSYEIITNPAARGAYFAENGRSVTATGVASVMDVFLGAHGFVVRQVAAQRTTLMEPQDDVACEDALLDAFVR